jgi:putative transposase
MARPNRQAPGGIHYHVLNRAVARIKIFRNDGDRDAFEKTLLQAHARLPTRILAYCVMPNHWHLVVHPRRDGELSRFIYWLTLTHAQRWRAAHNTVGFGPLYQGRFKSFPIQDDSHLLTVLRYVERNPLRVGLVDRAENWHWCSLHRRLEDTPQYNTLLSNWPIRQPNNWIDVVNRPQTAAEERAVQLSITRSRPYGSAGWQRSVARRLGLLSTLRPPGRPKSQKA